MKQDALLIIARLPLIVINWSLSAVLKLLLLLPSAIGVFLSVLGDGYRRTPWIWRWAADAENTPVKYQNRWDMFYYWAIRNPVKCMQLNQVPAHKLREYGGIDESQPGFQWRYRWAGYLDSFRVVWGEPSSKGKKEFYIGWKIGSPSPNKFTVQLRPF